MKSGTWNCRYNKTLGKINDHTCHNDIEHRQSAASCVALIYSCRRRNRSALDTTDTELSDMARAAMIGLSKMPNAG